MPAKRSGKLARLALDAGRGRERSEAEVADIITFAESDWGLQMRLFPVQRILLKAYYGLTLDETSETAFTITDWRHENPRQFTEADYLRYLFDEGRCNIREVVEGRELHQLCLSIGRRSGKTLLSSCVVAYETYRLINKGNPQKYYGLNQTSTFQLVSIATSKEQASLLYNECAGHYRTCDFFRGYATNQTQSFARFQTPNDIAMFGDYATSPTACASIRVTFHACNAKGLRGAGNIVVVLDEVAHFVEQGGSSAEEVWKAIGFSVGTFSPKDEHGEPRDGPLTLSDGRVIFISSPLGKQGLFYEKFTQGMKGGEGASDLLCIQAPTWEVNPKIPVSVFLDKYAEDPRIFFTEFGGEFTDRTLGWLEDPRDLLRCIDPALRPRTRGVPRRPYFVGFDLGLVKDASAIAIVHIDDEGRIVLDYIGQMKAGEGDHANREQLDFEDVAQWIHTLSRQFAFHKGLFDQWGAIPLEQALAKRGLTQFEGQIFSPQHRSEIWQNLKSMLWDRVGTKPRLQLYDISEQDKQRYAARGEKPPEHLPYIQQLLWLQSTYKSKYVFEVAAPNTEGKHDDLADAFARAVWLASQHLGKLRHIARTSNRPEIPRMLVSPREQRKNRRNRLLGGSDPMRQLPYRRRA